MTMGNTGYLQMGHALCGHMTFEQSDEVALRNLCMVQIHLNFEVGPPQGLNHRERLLL